MFAELQVLIEAGVNVWYDEGIDPGSEWPDEFADSISRCKALLFFASPDSVASRNCNNEIQYARDHDKPIVLVYLEQMELPPALQLTLATTHALQRYSLDRATYRAQLIGALRDETGHAPQRAPRFAMTPRRRERLGWSFVLVLVAAVAGYLALRSPPPRDSTPGTRFSIEVPANLDITPESYFEMFVAPPLAISPDGRDLVYSARDTNGEYHLFWRAVDRFDARQIPETNGATSPFFSPDGEDVGFVAQRSLRKVALRGGRPETIVAAMGGSGFGGANWSADGTIIYSPSAVAGLHRVSDAGGTPEQLSEPDGLKGELSHVMPQILPEGRSVLFSVRMGLAPESPIVQVLDLTTGERRTIVEGGMGAK